MTARMSALTHEIELLKSGPKDRYSWSYLLIIGIVFLVLVTLTVTAALVVRSDASHHSQSELENVVEITVDSIKTDLQ